MAKRTPKKTAPKKAKPEPVKEITHRDPEPQHRDPAPAKPRQPRLYIDASMPTVCPQCKGTTRMDDGRHVDQIRQRVLEYRSCIRCGAKLAAGREMTPDEVVKLCDRREAMAEYEEFIRQSD